MTPEWLAAIAAVFSAIATLFAVIATWKAPLTAAKLAEQLRQSSERDSERRRQKLEILTKLMQERNQLQNAAGALNLIDIVFNESLEVRNAWSELLQALQIKPYNQTPVEERLRRLLIAITKDVGLADQLRPDDLARIHYPEIHAQEQLIKAIQIQQSIQSLQSGSAAPASNATSVWPPPPKLLK
jgi:uncharacterized protein DUF6680